MRLHAGETYECPVCQYQCILQTKFTHHLTSHNNQGPFPCAQCGRSFDRAHDLARHLPVDHQVVKVGWFQFLIVSVFRLLFGFPSASLRCICHLVLVLPSLIRFKSLSFSPIRLTLVSVCRISKTASLRRNSKTSRRNRQISSVSQVMLCTCAPCHGSYYHVNIITWSMNLTKTGERCRIYSLKVVGWAGADIIV